MSFLGLSLHFCPRYFIVSLSAARQSARTDRRRPWPPVVGPAPVGLTGREYLEWTPHFTLVSPVLSAGRAAPPFAAGDVARAAGALCMGAGRF